MSANRLLYYVKPHKAPGSSRSSVVYMCFASVVHNNWPCETLPFLPPLATRYVCFLRVLGLAFLRNGASENPVAKCFPALKYEHVPMSWAEQAKFDVNYVCMLTQPEDLKPTVS